MGEDDEKKVSSAIAQIQTNERTANNNINNLIHINAFMSEQISNITSHISK